MFESLREQARGRKSPWNILQVMLLFSGMLGAWFFMIKTVWAIQDQIFPTNTILSSETELGEILITLPLFFLSIPIGAMLTDFIILSIPSAKKDFERELNGPQKGWLKSSMQCYLKIMLVAILILVPITIIGFYNYFYMTPSGITLRLVPWIPEKHYGWDDIAKIKVCSLKDRNGYIWSYILSMKDGASIELLKPDFRKFMGVFEKIKPFILSRKNIAYDYNFNEQAIMELRQRKSIHNENFIRAIKNED